MREPEWKIFTHKIKWNRFKQQIDMYIYRLPFNSYSILFYSTYWEDWDWDWDWKREEKSSFFCFVF